jgi:two-component system, OmpR family, sensor kinase
MRAGAAALGAADTEARLPVPATGDELQALGITLNDLLDRLHRSLSAQRDFIADAGHELRTPLAIMSAELELAARPGRSPEELRSALHSARVETARLAELAEDLLLLATTPYRADEPVDLTDLLTEATAARAGAAHRAGIELSCHATGPCPTRGDNRGLRRAVDNLLTNALGHTPPGGRVHVSLTRTDDRVNVDVVDTGAGFPPQFLPHAFTRFRRGDPARTNTSGPAGTGLGLAIVAAIAEQHHGHATAANNDPPPGARVTITLPAATAPRPAPLAGQCHHEPTATDREAPWG